jgi:hypothetical protein
MGPERQPFIFNCVKKKFNVKIKRMATHYSTNSGMLNNAGWQSVAGKGVYSADRRMKEVLGPNESLDLEWLQGPSPETLFKRATRPNPVDFVKVKPCKDSFDSQIEPQRKRMFVVAPQKGYKQRGFTQGNLRGMSAIEHIGNGAGPESLISIDSGEPALIDIPASAINDEATKYRWGNQDSAPNYGLGLPGCMPIHLRGHTAGRIVTTHKRVGGVGASGYYAGWGSAKANETGVVDPQRGS